MLHVALLAALAAVPADEVKALPGFAGALPSKHYSGFLSLGNSSKRLHYYLVTSHGSPSADPLVLWLNGGPGCSSLDGLLYEHGPLLVAPDGKTLVPNPYAWSTVANMLYLEAPAGVGFSYSADKADYRTGDAQTAVDNLAALHAFFGAFPELKRNEFYVSGESYGGVYVPTLSLAISKDATADWNMQGFLVGNGVFEGNITSNSHVPFTYGHGLISTKLYGALGAACGADFSGSSAACQRLKAEMYNLTSGLNMYDVYRDCYSHEEAANLEGSADVERFHAHPHTLRRLVELRRPPHPAVAAHMRRAAAAAGMVASASAATSTRMSVDAAAAAPAPASSLGENVPCIDSSGGTTYLARADVKQALHVTESPLAWTICSDVLDYRDDGAYPSLLAVYRQMIPGYRVLVYNGDTDPGCNYLGDEACTAALGQAETEAWRPWLFGDAEGSQVGGFVTSYANDVTFLTVKGSGHMVPQFKPQPAVTFFERFLKRAPM